MAFSENAKNVMRLLPEDVSVDERTVRQEFGLDLFLNAVLNPKYMALLVRLKQEACGALQSSGYPAERNPDHSPVPNLIHSYFLRN